MVRARLYFDSYDPSTVEDYVWKSVLSKKEDKAAITVFGSELEIIIIDGKYYLVMSEKFCVLKKVHDKLRQGIALLPGWRFRVM